MSEGKCLNWRTLSLITIAANVCLLSLFSHIRLFETLWTISCQAPQSMGFSKECWSGLPCSPPGDLPSPGIELVSSGTPALAGGFFTISTTWKVQLPLTESLFCARHLLKWFMCSQLFIFTTNLRDWWWCPQCTKEVTGVDSLKLLPRSLN